MLIGQVSLEKSTIDGTSKKSLKMKIWETMRQNALKDPMSSLEVTARVILSIPV